MEKGGKHDWYTKQKISDYAKNKSKEHRENISLSLTGRKLSEETKAKISASMKNKKVKKVKKAQGVFTKAYLQAIKDKIAEQSKHSQEGECYEKDQIESPGCSHQENDGNGI